MPWNQQQYEALGGLKIQVQHGARKTRVREHLIEFGNKAVNAGSFEVEGDTTSVVAALLIRAPFEKQHPSRCSADHYKDFPCKF